MKEHLKLLGFSVKDRLTGKTGTVTSVSFDVSGCVMGFVQPLVDKEGKSADGGWYDIKRLQVLGKKSIIPQPTFEFIPGGQSLPALPQKSKP